MKKLILLLILLVPTTSLAADLGTDAQKEDGKQLYIKYCVACHGETGDGKGPAADYFTPLPRDFTQGKYKIRTTASGELPTDKDIFLAIKNGLAFKATGAYTVMPPWPQLTDEQLMNLVYYLKTFSADFADPDYNNPPVIEIPSAISSSEESIKKGRVVFENNECVKCHGENGRGNGRSAPTLEDSWDQHIRPADLTKPWTFRGGSTREEVFRTISTGFNGTPMPAYADTITPEDRWHLVNYLGSLASSDLPNYNQPDSPIKIHPTKSEIDISDVEKAKTLFNEIEAARIPIVGQVVQVGRSFAPGVNQVDVKAIYNEKEIAVLLSWHDMSAETSGENTPDMEVPLFEPGGGEVSDDPFGDEVEEEVDPFAEEEEGGAYADAIAIQIPTERMEGFKKPYFIYGDSAAPVHLWHASLNNGNTPNLYLGKGAKSLSKVDGSSLTSVSSYDDGIWTVIFKRDRIVEDGISFDQEETFIPVGISVWDGFAEERGNKRGITSWFSFYQEPMEKPSVWGPVARNVILLFLLQLILIYVVRRSKKSS